MINICKVRDKSDSTQLALKLLDLEFPEKDYQEFKIGLKDQIQLDIPVQGSDLFESGVAIIPNLIPETVYEITASVKHNDYWENVVGTAFITQIKSVNPWGDQKPVDTFMGMVGTGGAT